MAFLGILLCAGGATLVWLWSKELGRGRASRNWPSTRGVIINSNIESSYRTSVEDPEMDADRLRYMNHRIRGPKVIYRYRVEGREHTHHRIQFCLMFSGSLRRNQRLISRFPEGSTLEVVYDPADPAQAILIRGANPVGAAAITALGALMVLAGIWIVLG